MRLNLLTLFVGFFSTLKTPASDSDQFDLLKVPYHSDSLHSFEKLGYCIAGKHVGYGKLITDCLIGNFTQQQSGQVCLLAKVSRCLCRTTVMGILHGNDIR